MFQYLIEHHFLVAILDLWFGKTFDETLLVILLALWPKQNIINLYMYSNHENIKYIYPFIKKQICNKFHSLLKFLHTFHCNIFKFFSTYPRSNNFWGWWWGQNSIRSNSRTSWGFCWDSRSDTLSIRTTNTPLTTFRFTRSF